MQGLISRRRLVAGLSLAVALGNRAVAATPEATPSFTGPFSGVEVKWSERWRNRYSGTGDGYDFILLKASGPEGGDVSLQVNVIQAAWESVAEAADVALDSWLSTLDGSREIEEIIATWTNDEAVGYLIQYEWNGEQLAGYIEFAPTDTPGVWLMMMLDAESIDAEALEALLAEVSVDGGLALRAEDLDEIAEELVKARGNL